MKILFAFKKISQKNCNFFKLKSNRYNDFTGKNYKKFLYIKKTISGDTPTITLLDDQNNPIEGKPILRNLPDYTNIILNYDDSEGEFTIKLKDNLKQRIFNFYRDDFELFGYSK